MEENIRILVRVKKTSSSGGKEAYVKLSLPKGRNNTKKTNECKNLKQNICVYK